MDDKLYRIIDVNLNRAKEGIRVCEEISRFVLEDATLTDEFRSLRHRIFDTSLDLPLDNDTILQARDTKSDVGRLLKDEKRIVSLQDLFLANMSRAKEALRVLEEFSKLIDIPVSKRFCGLRFDAYELEKKGFALLSALHRNR